MNRSPVSAVEAEAPGVAEAERPDLGQRPSCCRRTGWSRGTAYGDRAVDVDAQDLAEQHGEILGAVVRDRRPRRRRRGRCRGSGRVRMRAVRRCDWRTGCVTFRMDLRRACCPRRWGSTTRDSARASCCRWCRCSGRRRSRSSGSPVEGSRLDCPRGVSILRKRIARRARCPGSGAASRCRAWSGRS